MQLLLGVLWYGCLTVAFGKPHVLLVVVDDLGRTDHELYHESDIHLPNMLSLSKSGVRLDDYYTQQVCSPTRSALMTGMFPFRTGLQHTTTLLPGTTAHLPLDRSTLAEKMKKEGYHTGMLGKWHLGMAKWKYTPHGRGFDEFHGYLQGQEDYYNKTTVLTTGAIVGGGMNGYDYFHNFEVDRSADGGYSMYQYEARFKEYVAKYNASESDKVNHPLFVYYSHQTVHVPLQSGKEEASCSHIKDKWRKVFCSMLVEFDNTLGATVKTLREYKMWDDTLLLLTTDNGGMVRFAKRSDGMPIMEASVASNYPLRGSKATLFEGGVRGTAFITGGKNIFPGHARGTTYKELMHAVDFHAIAAAAASSPSYAHEGGEQQDIDGWNLLPNILSSVSGYSNLPSRTSVPININYWGKSFTAIRFGPWKLIIKSPTAGLNNDGWYPTGGGEPELANDTNAPYHLFNLEDDLSERTNLASERPDLVKKGIALIHDYMKKGYQPPQPNLPHLRSLPIFNNGNWAPFLGEHEDCIREPTTATSYERKSSIAHQGKIDLIDSTTFDNLDADQLKQLYRRLQAESPERHRFVRLSPEEEASMAHIL